MNDRTSIGVGWDAPFEAAMRYDTALCFGALGIGGIGVALAMSDQPDLILMDIHLPGMDGLAATALLKRTRATAIDPLLERKATST